MLKLIARLNRAHKRAALRHELRQVTIWGGHYGDHRAPQIVRELADLDAKDCAAPWPRLVPSMPLLQRAAPTYPRRPEPFATAARQVLIIVIIALALGALWN